MQVQFETVSQELSLPHLDVLSRDLERLTAESDTANRCVNAVVDGIFAHPDGRKEHLNNIRLAPAQLALIAHLAKLCPTSLSIDIGFGMGSSAAMILAARRAVGAPFEHLVFDPWGLGDGKGSLVEEYLSTEFPQSFRRIWKRSEVGLPQLFEERGQGAAGLVFIDGGHTFEQVIVDFFMADLLCGVGAYIVFDDSYFPAIETVVEYIRANRPDYAVAHLPVVNTSVIQKITASPPAWDSFRPFPVPLRTNWTPSDPSWFGDLPFARLKG